MENIQKKFDELGGITFAAEKEENQGGENRSIEQVREMMGILPEQQVLDFAGEFGFAYFYEAVGIIPINPPPIVSKKEPHCPVGRFYGYGYTRSAVTTIINTYEINTRFFPICDGSSGDMILYSLEESTLGKIYYWHHESDPGADQFLIANNFDDFISRLEGIKPVAASDPGKAKRTSISPQMLALMNKTRAQKGLPPLTEEEALK